MVHKVLQQTLSDLGVGVDHYMFSCPDCLLEGQDVIHCPKSHYHQDHPFHEYLGLGQEHC